MSHDTGRYRLQPFDRSLAPRVVEWIRGENELRLVSPYTPPPLTVEKVLAWRRGGQESLFLEDREAGLVGYGELAPAAGEGREWWIAHLVVDPARRGAGVGRAFINQLLERAFERHRATHVILSVFDDNAPALACYEHCGFRPCGRRPVNAQWLRPGPPLIDMRIGRFNWMSRRWKDRLAEAGADVDWAAHYRRYAALRRAADPRLDERLAVALRAAGLKEGQAFQAADLGAGPGLVAEAIARRFPLARVVAFEADPLCVLMGEQALGEAFGGRIVFEPADLRESGWSRGRENAFRLAASALALHWLSRRSLRRLYADLALALAPGGVFVNSDHVSADSSPLGAWAKAAWRRAFGRGVHTPGQEASQLAWTRFWAEARAEPGIASLYGQMRRELDVYEGSEPGHPRRFHLSTLQWAGFEEAREIWRLNGEAVILARKP